MGDRRCIYCNKGIMDGIEFSDSDIIPDALTNRKIINKNVCKIEHNSKFSDLFEWKIIEELGFVANSLDIKSSKSKKYPEYNASFIVGDKTYNKKIESDNKVFTGILRDKEGTTLMGPLDSIKKIAKSQGDIDAIQQVNLNTENITKMINFKLDIYFCEEMYRLVAKIGYEWYCKVNKIHNKLENFEEIVDFITLGQSDSKIVEIIEIEAIYKYLYEYCDLGSHFLISYVDKDNQVYVCVNLFGILLYRVKVSDTEVANMDYNYFMQEIRIDGSIKELYEHSLETLGEGANKSMNAFIDQVLSTEPYSVTDCGGIKVNTIISPIKEGIEKEYNLLITMYNCLTNTNNTDNVDAQVQIIKYGLNKILQESALTQKALKRYVKDTNITNIEALNENNDDGHSWFLLYVLFIMGNSELKEVTDIKQITDCVKESLKEYSRNYEYYDINKENVQKIKAQMLQNTTYLESIKRGAKLITNWK